MISDKLNELSSKIKTIRTGLDNTKQPIEKLSQDLDDIVQTFNALHGGIKSRQEEILAQLKIQDEKQQEILQKEGFKGLQFDEIDENGNKEEKELEKLEDAIKQLEPLENEIRILKRLVENKKLQEGKISKNDARSFIKGERDRISKAIDEKEKTASANKIVDNLNKEYLKYAKEIIKSNPLYKKSSDGVRNRIDTAQDMNAIKTIIDSRALYFIKRHDASITHNALYFWQQLDVKGIEEALKADFILEKSNKQVVLNPSNNIWELADKKQSTTVNHPKVDAINAGQSK